ncbi:hypothetical protein [Reichenbachiella sp. 5M10]|uniref:hypothetical protein n=1 Tax=Reichenbachiella sp. 5M10 TaxID=1889772 RepID=UPI00117B4A88|nr:hypothetical protein [Reichenbachiella sp. 5M10]
MIDVKQYSLERSVLVVICLACLIKVLHGMMVIYSSELSTTMGLLYLVLSGVLCFTLVCTFVVERINYISVPLSVFLLVVMSMLWIYTGGLVAISEFSFMAVMVIIGMINRGIWVIVLTGLACMAQLVLVYVWYFQFDLISEMVLPYIYNVRFFQVTLFVVATSFIYMTYRYGIETEKQLQREEELSQGIEDLEIENVRLEEQEQELSRMNKLLERKVSDRSSELSGSNQSIRDYLEVSSHEITPGVQRLTRLIDEMNSEHELYGLLQQSVVELSRAVQSNKVKKGKTKSK